MNFILCDMENTPLYQKIAENIRQAVLNGEIKPGERLPSVRELAAQWNCTLGTAQHAYRELAAQGLTTSRAGQGTRVVSSAGRFQGTPLRRAALVHRAESFLLEVFTAGYTPREVEAAMRQALDRWRISPQEKPAAAPEVLRFSGSHDLAMTWIASHFNEIAPGFSLNLELSGSLGGLIALAEGKADLAGCHLWDQESSTYNLAFIRRLLPGRRTAVVNLAYRRMGWMLPPGNPAGFQKLEDLTKPQIKFVNRQSGSGTRVWLDALLHRSGIPVERIQGYELEKMTHFEVARSIAEGQANLGFGLEAAALEFALEFTLLVEEEYDLVIPSSSYALPAIQALLSWLSGQEVKDALQSLGGYNCEKSGKTLWVE